MASIDAGIGVGSALIKYRSVADMASIDDVAFRAAKVGHAIQIAYYGHCCWLLELASQNSRSNSAPFYSGCR